MIKRILLVVMAVFYVLAGVNHFANPDVYLPMMPPYLPWHRALILISGVAEVGLGLAILIPSLRSIAAWGLILMLVAIFPANLHIALNNVPLFGNTEGFGVWNWARLPFQAVLIAWAWWYTDPTEAPADRRRD
ncbi:MAG: DoxX family protein [Candidatus Binatia bacterium]